MASEIFISTIDGLTLYGIVRRASDKQVWNTHTAAFEAFNGAHWFSASVDNYAIAMTKTVISANIAADYAATMPAAAAGTYFAEVFSQPGANPAVTDAPYSWIIEDLIWSGTALLFFTFDANGILKADIEDVLGHAATVDANNALNTSVKYVGGTLQTARDIGASVLLAASQHVIVDSGTITTLTNLPSIPANWITAAGINAAALNGKGDWSTVTPINLTAAQIATGVWTDSNASDFTTVTSIGKALFQTSAPGVIGGLAVHHGQMDLISAPNATAVTAIQAGLATPTNITGGTITTVTNLTNLPSIPANWLTAAGINAGAITTGAFTAGAINSTVAPHLDADVSSRAATGAQMDLVNVPNPTAVTAFQLGLATGANLAAAKAEIDAIKVPTDQMRFTVANKVDASAVLDTSGIAAQVASALVGQSVIVQSPVGRGSISIVAEDAYLTADSRCLTWVKPPGANWPTDLTGWTITFTATKNPNNLNTGTPTITASGTATVLTGPSQTVTVDLTTTNTTGLAHGQGNAGYTFDVVATKSGDRATLVQGLMAVTANVTA